MAAAPGVGGWNIRGCVNTRITPLSTSSNRDYILYGLIGVLLVWRDAAVLGLSCFGRIVEGH